MAEPTLSNYAGDGTEHKWTNQPGKLLTDTRGVRYEDSTTESPMRDTSIEEDLNTLEEHYRALQVVQANILGTKKRIESKNDANSQRIAKLYEAIAMASRGEAVPPRGEW